MAKRTGFKFGIGFKLISIISTLITLSLGGLIFLASYFFKQDNEIRIKENNLQISELIAKKVSTDIKGLIDKVSIIGNLLRFEANQAQSPGNRALSQTVFEHDSDVFYTAIIEPDHENGLVVRDDLANELLLAGSGYNHKMLSRAIEAHLPRFSGSLRGESIVFNFSPVLGFGALALAVPYDGQQEFGIRSFLLIVFDYRRLNESVRSDGIVKSYIVNSSGELLAHFDPAMVKNGSDLSQSPVVKQLLTSSNPNGQIRYIESDEVWHLGSYQKVDFAGIGVVSSVNEEKAMAAVYQIQRRNILISLLVLNFAIMVIWVFAKSLTKPVRALARAALKVKEGEYQLDIQPSSRDEIGELTGTFVEMAQGLAEREKMKEAFGKFVNKEIAEKAMQGELKLGGERKEVAIFFSDIRAFTAISEQLEPEEVVEFLNEYMTRMVNCVNATKGVVDKFIGDAIMAVWGTPVSYGNDVENAVNGALLMRQALIEFNADRGGPRKPIIKIGCGINIGPVIAGQIGSQERMEYTVIGDAVNLASRIETLNKPFRTDILISQDVFERVGESFITQAMQKIKVKGKSEPQQIYAVIARRDDPGGPQTLEEVRELLGIENFSGGLDLPGDSEEVKYEILD